MNATVGSPHKNALLYNIRLYVRRYGFEKNLKLRNWIPQYTYMLWTIEHIRGALHVCVISLVLETVTKGTTSTDTNRRQIPANVSFMGGKLPPDWLKYDI